MNKTPKQLLFIILYTHSICIIIIVITGHYHVLWTDYTDSALLYECYRVEADQLCSPGADHIMMLSRTHNMSDDTFDMLMQKAESSCFEPHDLVFHNINRAVIGIY